jgi:mono/diheme cytochrome c family protein
MRDLEGRGEGDPICKLVILEDTDEDGRADKQIVYLDGLVMPRSFAFVEGGVLLAEPPNLWYCQDLDGDSRCDKRTKVGSYGVAGNPQHTANGLRRGIDNWLHSADWGKRHQFRNGELIEEETIHRGQFGVSFDDFGRFFTCHESNAATADFIPAEYLLRNPKLIPFLRKRDADELGVHISIARNAQVVFPIRPTPQITLGGLELRDDGTLRTYTIVAGTCVYRGDQFPEDARGNLFVPEAGGHLVGRLKLEGSGLTFDARRFYQDGQELIASTDERFRPVNARTGPDGAIYIADMYHGIIEHVIFMVPWVADQIKARRLEEGNDLGRLWRIVYEGNPISRKSPQLSAAPVEQLITALDHPNGWWRDTAQRLLVDGGNVAAIPLLKTFTRGGKTHLGRMHALWALAGMGALDWDTAEASLTDPHEYVRATALRVMEPLLTPERAEDFLDALTDIWLANDTELVLQQALLSLGELPSQTEDYFQMMSEFLMSHTQPLATTAALTSLNGRELEFLQYIVDHGKRPRTQTLLSDLAKLVVIEGNPKHVAQLLKIGEEGGVWANMIADAVIAEQSVKNPIGLAEEPKMVVQLSSSDDLAEKEKAMQLRDRLTWPGNTPWRVAQVDLKPLTTEQAELAKLGGTKYAQFCASCHQPHGGGAPGLAPPLGGSEWVSGPPERLAKIVLHGLIGPIEVRNQEWNLHMPGLGFAGAVDDHEIAAILTFVRRAWGNRADPVAQTVVSQAREAAADRKFPWTAKELGGPAIGEKSIAPTIINSNVDGSIVLTAKVATVLASKLRYHDDLDILGPWVVQSDVALWHLQAPAGGRYQVHLLHACDDTNAGNAFVIETDHSQLKGKIGSTGGFDQFKEVEIGAVELKEGANRLLMRPDGTLNGELVDLRLIRLRPIGDANR